MAEIKTYKERVLPGNPKPNAVYWTKASNSSDVIGYITDVNGVPYPLKDLQGSGGITTLTNTDGNLVITGANSKTINIAPALLSLINSALQSGANISELVNDEGFITIADIPTNVSEFTNDAGYLTTFTETDPIFQASEASNFVAGDKAKLDNQSGVNSGDETTLSIQTKRPLKTINGESLEGSGNITVGSTLTNTSELINDGSDGTSTYVEADELGAVATSNNYNDLDNLPIIPTQISNHSELNLDDGTNPHGTTKTDVGLGNVPNVDTSTTSNVSEGSNLYFTTTRVLATVLSGLSLATGGAIISTDSILVAFGKIQKQIDDLTTSIGNKVDKVTTAGVERAYIINADGSQGTKATSEIGTTQNYFTFSTNTTLSNSHHNAVIWVTATINITIPSGLRSDFNCTFRTLTGVTATFLTSGTTINAESDGDVQAEKTMSYLAQYTTNNYIISGGGLS